MASRKDQRIENKKRKAAAFLELVSRDDKLKSPTEGSPAKIMKSESRLATRDDKKTNPNTQSSLSDEMYAEYKKQVRKREREAMERPKVFLTLDELTRNHPYHTDENGVCMTPPLFMADIQHLLMFSLVGNFSSFKPRWCKLLRVGRVTKTVAIVLDGLSAEEFDNYKESLPTLQQAFDLSVDITSPCQYGSSVREDIMNVPVSFTRMTQELPPAKAANGKVMVKDYKCPSEIAHHQKWRDVYNITRALYSNPLKESSDLPEAPQLKPEWTQTTKDNKRDRNQADNKTNNSKQSQSPKKDSDEYKTQKNVKTETNSSTDNSNQSLIDAPGQNEGTTSHLDKFDRRWLLLNNSQIILEGIPTPTNMADKSYNGFVFSKPEYKQVTRNSPMFAVDCEMVQSRASKMDLARVSIVDEHLEVVLDMFVKPRATITNYVTQFSGITEQILRNVKTRLEDVQHLIRKHLPPDAILCGQSIGSDLRSMKLFHPYLIDTSVIYNLTGNKQKTGLRKLTSMFLSRSIQDNPTLGHSSVEDSIATMELVLLKLRNDLSFGDITSSKTVSFDGEPVECDDMQVEVTNDNETKTVVDMKEIKVKEEKVDETETMIETKEMKVKEEKSGEIKKEAEVTKGNEVQDKKEIEDKVDEIEVKVEEKKGNKVKDERLDATAARVTTTELPDTMSPELRNKRLFFRQHGRRFIRSFIQFISNHKKTGSIVDEEASVKLYPADQKIVTCSSDKDSQQQTLKCISEVDYCFTHLFGYRNFLRNNKDSTNTDQEQLKKCLWKLDRRFWKIMIGLPQKSLVVVILPGREDNGQVKAAKVFAKVII